MLKNKSWRKKEEGGGHVRSDGVTLDGALLSWRWLHTCLTMGSSEQIPCFAFLV